MKKLTRRQAVALAATMAVGTTVTKPAVASLDYRHCLPSRFDNLQDLLVDVIRHAQRTGDKIIEACSGGSPCPEMGAGLQTIAPSTSGGKSPSTASSEQATGWTPDSKRPSFRSPTTRAG